MKESSTIAAVASPPGTGAVSLIRLSGNAAARIAGEIFDSPAPELSHRVQHHGHVTGADGDPIDEVLLTLFRGPRSYTGEDLVEISCHGGILVTRRVLERILEAGARPAAPGEFSQRAFLNGKLDLTQAEAVMDLITAQTDLALKSAREQLSGRLGRLLMDLREELIGIAAHVEAYIDFPEEDIDPETGAGLVGRIESAREAVDRLIDTADQGKILREGVRTVICGAPNVGKSSLLNVLLGFDRAIVSETAGTTRDYIEEVISLRGIPLRLVDTAGMREAGDDIEREGISRTRAQLDTAGLILDIADGSRPREEWHPVPVDGTARVLRIRNKADLGTGPGWDGEQPDTIAVSCRTGEGIERLGDAIFDLLSGNGDVLGASHLIAINARHKHSLGEASAYLAAAAARLEDGTSPEFAALEIRSALDSIGEVVGKTDVEEILGAIFSTFCIGK